jgi:hypothetical protein
MSATQATMPPALEITIPAEDVCNQVSAFEHRMRCRAVREHVNHLRAAEARVNAPVRIRAEPANRDLALEQQIDQEHSAHHQRRCEEEITAVRHKFSRGRNLARLAFELKTDKIQQKYKKRVLKLVTGDKDDWELLRTLSDDHGRQLGHEAGVYQIKLECLSSARKEAKIAYITKRRAELAWTCPNDGQAYPFTWEGNNYHRTYDGEMWLTSTWEWRGEWAGYYIARANPPQDWAHIVLDEDHQEKWAAYLEDQVELHGI